MVRNANCERVDERMFRRAFSLVRGDVLRVWNGCGALISVRQGTAWLTQNRDQRDIILRAGDWFQLDRNGLAVVEPTGAAAITVTASVAPANDLVFDQRQASGREGRGHPFKRSIRAWWLRLNRYRQRAIAAHRYPY